MEFSEAWDDTCSAVGLEARNGSIFKLQQLVTEGAPVDVADNRGWKPLHEAVVVPNGMECLKELLQHDCTDVNWQTHEGETALLLACKRRTGDSALETIELLLQNSADPNICDNESETPLLAATKAGNISMVKSLLRNSADANVADCSGWYPLHEAGMHGKIEILRCLLDIDARIDVQDECGITPIFSAAQHGQKECLVELLKIMLERDQNKVVDMGAEDFATPLMIAAQQGFTDCVDLLLGVGANPDLRTTDNTTALHLAVQGNHVDCLKLLIDKMNLQPLIDVCNPQVLMSRSSSDIRGICPLHLAVEWESYECLQILLDTGFSPDSIYDRPALQLDFYLPPVIVNRESAFSYAVFKGNAKAMAMLLQAGASLNVPTQYSLHPLIRALSHPSPDILNFLLDIGSDVNYCRPQFRNNEVFLTAIVMQYHIDEILYYGCDPMLCFQDDEGIKLFSIAIVRHTNRPTLVRLLDLVIKFVVLTSSVQKAYGVIAERAREESKYEKRLWSDISSKLEHPSSLKHICRISIRQTMYKVHFSRFVKFVPRLPLPTSMQDYLLFNTV